MLSKYRAGIRIQRMYKNHYTQVKRYRVQPLKRIMHRAHWLRWSKIEGKIETKR
jgi:hypothetical protein